MSHGEWHLGLDLHVDSEDAVTGATLPVDASPAKGCTVVSKNSARPHIYYRGTLHINAAPAIPRVADPLRLVEGPIR